MAGGDVNMSDLPDYQIPINIQAVTLETLPIDIKAQTLGTLKIDISAQSVGNINVNIAASAVTLNVNIQSSAITVNVHETGTANVAITSSITLNINIASSAITLNVKTAVGEKVEIGIVSSIQLNVNIAASDITVNVHEAGTANVAIASSITLNISISASAINIPVTTAAGQHVDIDIVSSITLNINLTGSTITLNVNIASSAVTLNVAIQSSAVTLNIAIQSQAVDLNIKTSGGANIIIDKLTQASYVERRSTLENPALTTPPSFATTAYYAKFFPRGCRGYIHTINIRARNTTGSPATMTFAISPMLGMGDVINFSIVIPAGDDGTVTRSAGITKWWNYDSMFIYQKTLNTAAVGIGYDTSTPYDWFYSPNLITWNYWSGRCYISAVMNGETVGDIPVSGTINTIEIPHTSSPHYYFGFRLDTDAETTVATVEGAGESEFMVVRVAAETHSDDIAMRVYCDGNLTWAWGFSNLNAYGYVATTEKMSLLKYAADGECCVHVTLKFAFIRQFKVTMQRQAGSPDQAGFIEGMVNVIK